MDRKRIAKMSAGYTFFEVLISTALLLLLTCIRLYRFLSGPTAFRCFDARILQYAESRFICTKKNGRVKNSVLGKPRSEGKQVRRGYTYATACKGGRFYENRISF